MVEEGSSCSVSQTVSDGHGDHSVSRERKVIESFATIRSVMLCSLPPSQLYWLPSEKSHLWFWNSSSHPVDVFLPCWKRGRPAARGVVAIILSNDSPSKKLLPLRAKLCPLG